MKQEVHVQDGLDLFSVLTQSGWIMKDDCIVENGFWILDENGLNFYDTENVNEALVSYGEERKKQLNNRETNFLEVRVLKCGINNGKIFDYFNEIYVIEIDPDFD